jgi:hypothetical protein
MWQSKKSQRGEDQTEQERRGHDRKGDYHYQRTPIIRFKLQQKVLYSIQNNTEFASNMYGNDVEE